jgi:hypothetical protein
MISPDKKTHDKKTHKKNGNNHIWLFFNLAQLSCAYAIKFVKDLQLLLISIFFACFL